MPEVVQADAQDAQQGALYQKLSGKRVVIVEDQAMTVVQISKALRQAGMEVVGAAVNGIEGVHLVKKHRPDLVLMDINIPVMNGIEVARRVMESTPTCIVMITAYSDDGHKNGAHEAGVCGYVTKPFSAESLLPAIAEAYGSFQARAQ